MTSLDGYDGHIMMRLNETQGKEDSIISEQQFLAIAENPIFKNYPLKHDIFETARMQSCSAIVVYRATRDIEKMVSEKPKFQEIRREVKEISKLSSALSRTLNNLSEEALDVILGADRIAFDELISRSEDPSKNGRYGHPMYFRNYTNSDDGVWTWNLHNIMKMVEVLSNMSGDASTWVKPFDTGGRPKDEAINRFVLGMRPIWESISDARFTFGQHKGAPITPAAVFCWELLKIADPQASFQGLSTAMRASAHRSGSGRGRPSVRKNQK